MWENWLIQREVRTHETKCYFFENKLWLWELFESWFVSRMSEKWQKKMSTVLDSVASRYIGSFVQTKRDMIGRRLSRSWEVCLGFEMRLKCASVYTEQWRPFLALHTLQSKNAAERLTNEIFLIQYSTLILKKWKFSRLIHTPCGLEEKYCCKKWIFLHFSGPYFPRRKAKKCNRIAYFTIKWKLI